MKLLEIIIFLTFISTAGHGAKISIRSQPLVTNEKVKLGDIASFEGFSSNEEKVLKAISLIVGLDRGTSHKLTNTALRNILSKYLRKLKVQKKSRIILNIPNEIVITRIFTEIPKGKIEARLKNHLINLCKDCRIEIKKLELPAIRITQFLDWNMSLPASLVRGNFNISVNLKYINPVGTVSSKMIWLRGYSEVWKTVPIFKNSFVPGERVSLTDFYFEERDITRSFEGIFNQKFLDGARLRRAVKAGGVAWSSTLEKEKSILKGQMVHASLIEGSVEVQVKAIAKQDAYVGDRLKLLNPMNKEIIEGIVVGQGKVEIR